MAVEIKEIVIKAILNQGDNASSSGNQTHVDQEEMIQECVAQVLKVLKKKDRR